MTCRKANDTQAISNANASAVRQTLYLNSIDPLNPEIRILSLSSHSILFRGLSRPASIELLNTSIDATVDVRSGLYRIGAVVELNTA